MDETQRLDYDEDEEETSAIRDRPVGNLHMFAGIHGPAQDFPIHRGQNVVGRHASCDITLPAQSVSKKHAILQVRGDCHTICDNGSLNKTRRAKVPLAPNIHYALSNGDFLLFADVACRYTIKEAAESETTAIEDSEDDSVLVPATQGALAIEKTPGAAIRRIARGAVLARDSGDEDEEQTRSDGGCGSFKDGHKTLGQGATVPPSADTIVPESDEENDTSTSESQLPSLNLQCDSDTDTSRRSSFVPSSQNISTPLGLKDQSKHDGRTLTAGGKEEETRKPTDTEVKLKLAVEDTTDGKETQEKQVVKSSSGGSTSESCVVISGKADEKLKEEEKCEGMLQDDATKKPSSESVAVISPCDKEDNVASSRSETVQEVPCDQNIASDAVLQKHHVEAKEDNVGLDSESNFQEKDTTTSGIDVNTAETSAIQRNKTEESGKSRSLGSGEVGFHMDSDTDEDEAVSTGSDLEKAKTPQAADTEKSENNVIEPVTSKSEGNPDSDTDVEGDQSDLKPKNGNAEVKDKMGELSKTEGSAALGIDSDTDDDDDDDVDLPKPNESKAEQESRNNLKEEKKGFQLDSDTDAEEDVSTAEVKDSKPESPKANVKETKDVFNLDSDTDVEEDTKVPSGAGTHEPQDSFTENVQEVPGVKSDTDDDEDDQIPGGSNVDQGKPSTEEQKDKTALRDGVKSEEAVALHVDSDTDDDTAMAEKVGAPKDALNTDRAKVGTEMTKEASAPQVDSDTDVDDDASVSEKVGAPEDTAQNDGANVGTEITKETAALQVDSDTDVDDEDASMSKKEEAPESITHSDSRAKAGTEVTKEAAAPQVDSDTDVDDDDASMSKKEGASEDNTHNDGANVGTEVTKEASALQVDSDTDVDDEDASVLKKVGAPESTTGSAKVGTEAMEAADLHWDSDTDVDDDDASMSKAAAPESTTHTDSGAKMGTEVTKKTAAPQVDSDTDVDDDDASVSKTVGAPESTTGSSKVGTEVMKEAAELCWDSDTDVDDDDASMTKKVGAPETTTPTDSGAKVGSEVIKEAADLPWDSDTDVEEDKVDTGGAQKESGVEDPNSLVSSANESAAVSEISRERTKNVPEEIDTDEDETQKSVTENVDLEMMPTQCYLETQEESDLQDEEEATQAFILSSTWAEPDPFKRPADPIGVLQISSVTLNASEEDIDENAIAETQDFCTETELRGPSVLETPKPVRRRVHESILQSSSNDEESGTEVQQLSHEAESPDATQPVSQDLSARCPQGAGTWLHLKRDVPATVWIRGIQQEGDSTDLEGGQETTQDATRTDEQSLNLELEATQSYVVENLSVQESPVQTGTPTDTSEPDVPPEKVEQPCGEEATKDPTQPCSLGVPDSENAATQACILSEEMTGDGDTRAVTIDSVPREDDGAQVVDPNIPTAEEVTPEASTNNKEKLSTRRGLSRSKRKKESAHNAPTSLETEEQPDKASVSPSSLTEEAGELGTVKQKLSLEPDVKTVEVEKEVRRRGGRRIAESAAKTTAKEDDLVTTTSLRRTSISSEAEPSASGIGKQRGRKQVSRKSAIKVVDEGLKVEQKLSPSIEELKSFAPEDILKAIGLTSEDKKGSPIEQISKESGDQASSQNKDSFCTDPSMSSTVTESEEFTEPNDNSATNLSKRTLRNRRPVATRLRKEATGNVEKDNENVEEHHLRILQEKERSKLASESLHSEKITEEQNQGRRGTRKSRLKSSEQELDKAEDTAVRATEKKKKSEEVCPADSVSENEKSRRTRRSLGEEVKEESQNIQEGRAKTRRGASVKGVEPKSKQKEKNVEELPEKTPKKTRNNSKAATTKPELEVKEDVKIEDTEVVRKSRRTQKNLKEEEKSEENSETLETSSNDAPTPRRTRKGHQGEDSMEKEEAVKETTSRRARRHSKEEEAVKLEEDQTKKSRTRRDSKEETKTKETSKESFLEENKEERIGRTSTRKTRKNLKDDEKTSVQEKKSKTVDNAKSERSSRSRSKASDESTELHIEEEKKGTEESAKLSPQEEKPKPAVGRGRRAAKKDDLSPVSTPVASRKRGQATKEGAEGKRKKSDEGANEEVLGEVETPKSRRGRQRKLDSEAENTQSVKESSPPDPSPSRSTRQRPSSARSSPIEARTPRRTNRMSTLAAASSPYAAPPGSAPKILFTFVGDTAGEETIRSLGGEIADSVFDCTHLVTDRVRRTVKFLCALARGIPIVTLDWIDKCKKSKCFLSPTGFLVDDKEQEKNFNFLLSESLQKAKKRPLFEGYEIHVTANVKPDPEQMKDIIRCSGATFLPKLPRSFKDKCIVVSCPEDAARCKSVPATVPITSAEFILSGILRQEVNLTAHLLNPAAPDSAPTPAKRRR